MDGLTDLIIVVVYFLAIGIVISQAIESLEDRITLLFDKSAFEEILKQRELDEVFAVNFGLKPEDRYGFDGIPSKLGITVENKSADFSIKVDWDRSAWIDFENRSRRAIRLPPDKRIDLASAQVSSTIAPKASLKENITAEDLLKLQEDGSITAEGTLYDLPKLKKNAESKKPPPGQKELFGKFAGMQEPLTFTLWLEVRVPIAESLERRDRSYTLPCKFMIAKMPWQDYLPFNPKK